MQTRYSPTVLLSPTPPLQRQKEYRHKPLFQSEIKGEAIALFESEGFGT